MRRRLFRRVSYATVAVAMSQPSGSFGLPPPVASGAIALSTNGARAAPGRTYSVRTVVAQDADEHAHNLSEWQQLYDQLAAGRFTGKLTELWLDGAQLFREYTSHTVRQSCVVWPESYWFGVPYSAGHSSKIDAKYIGDGTIALRPGACAFELLTPNDFDILGVVIDAQMLTLHALEVEHLDPRAILRDRELLQVGRATKRRFAQFVLHTLQAMQNNQAVRSSPLAQHSLQQAILCNLATLLVSVGAEPKTSLAHRHRHRLVCRVREHLLEHHSESLTVPDLCRQFHVSRRTLQNCFYEVLDTSPAAYLRSIRLNAVRRELKNPQSAYGSVQDVAASWGFWHLSQFASDYKRLFGELPSESLRARPVCGELIA